MDAQKKTIQYLKSSEFREREDAKDTLKSLEKLIQIIRGGFITENSQEGTNYKGVNKETGQHYEIHERAYVSGFMKKKEGLEFLDRMNKNTDKIAFEIQGTPSDDYTESKIVVTMGRSGKEKEFKGHTFFRTALPQVTIDFVRKGVGISKSEGVMFIACIDPVYGRAAGGRDGLYAAILKCLA